VAFLAIHFHREIEILRDLHYGEWFCAVVCVSDLVVKVGNSGGNQVPKEGMDACPTYAFFITVIVKEGNRSTDYDQ